MPLGCLVKSNFLICLTIQFKQSHNLLFRRNPNLLPGPGQCHAPRLERSLLKSKHIINRPDVAIIYGANDITRVNPQAAGPGTNPCLKNNNARKPAVQSKLFGQCGRQAGNPAHPAADLCSVPMSCLPQVHRAVRPARPKHSRTCPAGTQSRFTLAPSRPRRNPVTQGLKLIHRKAIKRNNNVANPKPAASAGPPL